MIGKQVFRTCIAVFLIAVLLCPSFGMLNLSTKIIGTATADYVDASNNTSCIEEDPLVPGWSKDVRLTNAIGDSMMPHMAIDSKNNIHVVWEDGRDEYWGIYYKRSIDYGNTWTETIRLTPSSDSGYFPAIAIDKNDTIHVVFRQWFSNGDEICYQKSMDEGKTWSQPTRLTHASGDSFTPAIAVYKETIHVVWSDERDGNFEIYYKKSLDNGVTWDEEDTKLSNTSGRSLLPSVATDSLGNVHVVWQEREGDGHTLYYRKSLDGGNIWLDGKKIIENPTVGPAGGGPHIAVDFKNNLQVVWADIRSRSAVFEEIFYKKSIDSGYTWTDDVNITQHAYDTDSWMPGLALDLNDNLYLVWSGTNRTENSNDLYYQVISDCEENLSSATRLTYVINGSRMKPEMAIDDNNILHLVWYDQRTDGEQNYEIYYKRTLYPVSEKPIVATLSLNQTSCEPGTFITVSGNAVYNGSVVQDANVSIKILETGDEWNTTTDLNGNYSEIIVAPDTPGNYTIRVTITSGNHAGWKMMRLSVEQETTNGDTTNDGQQPDGGENEQGINFNYVVMIVSVIATCIVIGVVLVKRRGKTAAKTMEKKTEKNTMNLRCPKCRQTFRVELKPKPFDVKCPYCGKEGTIK